MLAPQASSALCSKAISNQNRQDLICEGECEGLGHRAHFVVKDRSGAPLVDESLAEGATHENSLAMLLHWLQKRFQDHQLIAAAYAFSLANQDRR
jgi:hypothetical protein